MHLFVYYDVPHEAVDNALIRVRAMQSELRDASARLLRRPEPRDGGQTWMETYENVADGFEARLAASVERHRVDALTGPRHAERFEDLG